MEYLRDNVREVLVHQTKIGDVVLQETDSALFDDGSDDVVQMQIPHLIPFIEARSHAGTMLGCIVRNLTFHSCYDRVRIL